MYWATPHIFTLPAGATRTYTISWLSKTDLGDHGPQWIMGRPVTDGLVTVESISKEMGEFKLPRVDSKDGVGSIASGSPVRRGWQYRVTLSNPNTTDVNFLFEGGVVT